MMLTMGSLAAAATLEGEGGEVAGIEVVRGGQAIEVTQGMRVRAGDTVITGAHRATIEVPTCLDLVLYQYSSTTLEPFCGIRWNAGALLARAYGPLRADLGEGFGSVRGTRFLVNGEQPDGVRLSTFEGVVRVETQEGFARVAEGESVLVVREAIDGPNETPEDVVALEEELAGLLAAAGALRPHPLHLRVGVEGLGVQESGRLGPFVGLDGEVGGGFRVGGDLGLVTDADRFNLRLRADVGWRPGVIGVGVAPAVHVGGVGDGCGGGETLAQPAVSGEIRLAVPVGRWDRLFWEVEAGAVLSPDSRIDSSVLLAVRMGWDHAL